MPLKQDERYFHVQKSYKNHTDINQGKKYSCQQNWGKKPNKKLLKTNKQKQNKIIIINKIHSYQSYSLYESHF